MTATTESPVKYEYDRIPYLVAYQNTSSVRDVYGGVAELVVLESYLLKPKTKPSDTVLVFMHPIGGGAYLPMINALARAGHHVIYCNSRFRGTDSALLMEKVSRIWASASKTPRTGSATRRWCWPVGAAGVRCRRSTSSRPRTRR
jgi:hypothetical protein